MKQETKVGIVIILGTLAFATAIMILSGIRIFEKGYEIHILFNDVQGLLSQAKVQVAGVNVGYVKDITLNGGNAKVIVWLNNNVKIHKDANAYIFSSGIIGVKFIQLTQGTETVELLKDCDTIVGVDPISIDKMLDKTQMAVNSLMISLRSVTDDVGIKATIKNLNKFSNNLVTITEDNSIKTTLENFNRFSNDLASISKEVKSAGVGNRLVNISKKLDSTITSLDKISKSIESGNGVLGMLTTDKKLENDLNETIKSMRVFSKIMEESPSKWIVDDKKAKEVKKEIEKERKKNER